MATLVMTDAKIWLDGYNFSGDHNQISLAYSADMVDDTVFGDTTRSRKGGAKNVQFTGNGFWDSGTDLIDPTVFGKVGANGQVLALSPDGGDEGEVGYFFKPTIGAYNLGASFGEMFAFQITAETQHNLIRGTVMQNGTETTSTDGTSRQLGAVGATQKLYAAMHVLSASGASPTLDVLVRSDDNSGMTTPTTRVTFTQATGRTSQWATPVSGAITDTYWDISWTIGGTSSPTFNFVVVVGIL